MSAAGRVWAAAEATAAGRGGIAAVARASGMDEETIRRGARELESGERLEPGRVRQPDDGRKPLTETDPTLLIDLEALVDPDSRGDPCRPLRFRGQERAPPRRCPGRDGPPGPLHHGR